MRDAYWRGAYTRLPVDRERPVDRFLPLRRVEFDILLSLAAGERHGYGIIQDAEQRGLGDPPDVGTLYRGLRRLQDQGLIRPRDGAPPPTPRTNAATITRSPRSDAAWRAP